MYIKTIKNIVVNKMSKKIGHVNDLIKSGNDLIEYSQQRCDIKEGCVDQNYLIGWKSRVESFLSTLVEKDFYNNFKEHVVGDSESSVKTGISILDNCRRYLRSDYKNGEYWNYVNIFWLFWQLLKFLWKHKVISLIFTITIGLVIAYLTYKFGWNK